MCVCVCVRARLKAPHVINCSREAKLYAGKTQDLQMQV